MSDMVKSAETIGKPKWEKNTAAAAEVWKSEVTSSEAETRYVDNLGRSAGVSVGPITRGNWKAGVGATPAAEFARGVSGKADKWLRKFKAGVSR